MAEPVIFRKWKDGSVIALFPEYHNGYNSRIYNRDNVMSYMRVGQHSEASYLGVISQTVPASEEEYKGLFEELQSIGYDMIVKKRRPIKSSLPEV